MSKYAYEEEFANEVERKISVLGFSENAFCKAMSRAHRTNQQTFTSIVIAWIKECAELNEGQIDPRNEMSVDICRKLKKVLDEEGRYTLPMI